MSGSREESPDWLRTFEAPTQSILTLSSGSESSPNDSPLREDRTNEKEQSLKETEFLGKEDDRDSGEESSFNKTLKRKSPNKRAKVEHKSAKKIKADNCGKKGNGGDGKDAEKEKFEKHIEPKAPDNSVWNLSSDSESPYNSPPREASKGKSPKKRLKTEDPVPAKKKRVNSDISKKGIDGGTEIAEEEVAEKNIESRFSSSRLPLVLSEKASRTKALVECEGESIELSGDVGAVGRVVISDDPSGNHEMFLDLKGTMYRTTIVPSRTFCVVSFGQSEAKIEAIMNDFIQLKPQSNVYEAETMVEGTLDGFSFDSEDDADNVPKTAAAANQADQNEGSAEQSNKKAKTKAEKSSGVARKRGKVVGGKPLKKAKRKTQAPKKGKAKK